MEAPTRTGACPEIPGPQSVDILLATINARYIHSAFGLRYLYANMGPLQERTQICEWNLQRSTQACLADILSLNPKILGLGVYIWNIEESTKLVAALKQLRPDIYVVIGGPEVSYDLQGLTIAEDADLVVQGEADLLFAELCQQILAGAPPAEAVVQAPLPAVQDILTPYEHYNDHDVANRVVYVEVSRGCPFRCEFCLSSLPMPVRQFDLPAFLASMERLLDRGLRQFKFVDRTFNLNLRISQQILDFFYERYVPGLFLHFEMVPDRFPEALRDNVRRFPPGALQFEVGIQTFNEEVAARISRRQDNGKIEENLTFLRRETGVHIHADLIAGLPGEDVASFAAGFDRLLALAPQEIQLGVLKRLRGTPIVRHDEPWGMIYNPAPPYEILQTDAIDFFTMQKLQRLTKYWDKYGNSGNFVATLPLLWSTPVTAAEAEAAPERGLHQGEPSSPFWRFWDFCGWLFAQAERTHGLALQKLMSYLFSYLKDEPMQLPAQSVAESLWADYQRVPRPNVPSILRPYIHEKAPQGAALRTPQTTQEEGAPTRQSRHLASD